MKTYNVKLEKIVFNGVNCLSCPNIKTPDSLDASYLKIKCNRYKKELVLDGKKIIRCNQCIKDWGIK